MRSLNTLLRGRGVYRGAGYTPFSQPPFRGHYPIAPRGFSLTTNGLKSQAVSAGKIALLRARQPRSTLSLYEDRRLWHPQGALAWPKSKVEKYPRIMDQSNYQPGPYEPSWPPRYPNPKQPIPWKQMAKKSILNAPATTQWSWEHPYKMVICLKRKMRREVMNALGFAGKSGFKKPRYSQFSYVRCY